MYVKSEPFQSPSNEKIKIWRYMDFPKLLSLFENEALFFCRYDKLEDPYEGAIPKENFNKIISKVPNDLSMKDHEKYMKNVFDTILKWRKFNAVNCWHMNNYGPAAMWNLYTNSELSICIQSRFDLLTESITDSRKVYIGTVNYHDYDHSIEDGKNGVNIYNFILNKRMEFAHENELRAVVTVLPKEEDITKVPMFSTETIRDGVKINIDINLLIEAIYIHPSAPRWFVELTKKVIKTYQYNFSIIQSQLFKEPEDLY